MVLLIRVIISVNYEAIESLYVLCNGNRVERYLDLLIVRLIENTGEYDLVCEGIYLNVSVSRVVLVCTDDARDIRVYTNLLRPSEYNAPR